YHDGERVRFAVAIEGENNIRAGVRYARLISANRLNNGTARTLSSANA
ncbi:hypothetical protein O5472_26210, partial [Escherichia coli]|nr:hypothetical protein [Escherichia coli]